MMPPQSSEITGTNSPAAAAALPSDANREVNRTDAELEEDLRCFYDPAKLFDDRPLDVLLDKTAGTRQPAYMASLGRLAGHEIILAEAVHAMIIDGHSSFLPVDPDRQLQIRQAIHSYAGNLALSTSEIVDEIISGRAAKQADNPKIKWATLPPKSVMAGKVLAATAHDEQSRRSGRPYYDHPDEVSSILTAAWRKHMPRIPERDHEVDLYRFLNYTHDSYEDTLDPFGRYLSNRRVVVSPLVARKVLEHYDEPDAADIAHTLLYLTRTRDTEGNRMPYGFYIDRGIMKGRKRYIVTKAPDIQHNRNIEPDQIVPGDTKAMAKYRKRRMYDEGIYKLEQGAEQFDDPEFVRVIHAIATITRDEVKAINLEKYPLDIAKVAASLRANFAARLGGEALQTA